MTSVWEACCFDSGAYASVGMECPGWKGLLARGPGVLMACGLVNEVVLSNAGPTGRPHVALPARCRAGSRRLAGKRGQPLTLRLNDGPGTAHPSKLVANGE